MRSEPHTKERAARQTRVIDKLTVEKNGFICGEICQRETYQQRLRYIHQWDDPHEVVVSCELLCGQHFMHGVDSRHARVVVGERTVNSVFAGDL